MEMGDALMRRPFSFPQRFRVDASTLLDAGLDDQRFL